MAFHNDKTYDNMTTKQMLHCSPFVFHLTGSRFFGNFTENSDWDYFVQKDDKIEDFLSEIGFRKDTESYQGDVMMTSVWEKENIHIQIVNCSKMKQRVQDKLLPIFKAMPPNKEQAKILWKWAVDLYKDGMMAVHYGITFCQLYNGDPVITKPVVERKEFLSTNQRTGLNRY